MGWSFLESRVAGLGTTMVNRDRMMVGHVARDRRVLEGMMVVIQWFGVGCEGRDGFLGRCSRVALLLTSGAQAESQLAKRVEVCAEKLHSREASLFPSNM